jgi:5'-nucleotidase
VRILLTNDDGIAAPGLLAMEEQLLPLGDLTVVAPQQQCSGVSHSVTYLRPLTCESQQRPSGGAGWSVDGMPADCVRLAIDQLCQHPPELVVSGINSGLNAGINIIYSGTVAAAREAFFHGTSSVAVSLEASRQMNFKAAAALALPIIRGILAQQQRPGFYNINIPTRALQQPRGLQILPMSLAPYGDNFIRRQDPKQRPYYWSTDSPPPGRSDPPADVDLLEEGFVTVTPLLFDATDQRVLQQMQDWDWEHEVRPRSEPTS